MMNAIRLLSICLVLSLGAWAQAASSQAPKIRKSHPAGVHKMSPHAARHFSQQEKKERNIMRAQQRRQAKLATKQRRQATKRSRQLRKAQIKTQNKAQ